MRSARFYVLFACDIVRGMDLFSVITSAGLGFISVLLGLIAFFGKQLFTEFRILATEFRNLVSVTSGNNVKIETIQDQIKTHQRFIEDVSKMREDVAGLKVAVTSYIKFLERE